MVSASTGKLGNDLTIFVFRVYERKGYQMEIREFICEFFSTALDIAHGCIEWTLRAPEWVLENALTDGGFYLEETTPHGGSVWSNDRGEYAVVERG